MNPQIVPFEPRLIRLPVRKGCEERFLKWLRSIPGNSTDLVVSMQTERIRSEAVFSSTEGDRLYITWVILKNSDDGDFRPGDTELDRKHNEMITECIDFEASPMEAEREYGITVGDSQFN